MAAVRYGLAALAHADRDPASLLTRTDDHLRSIDDEAMVTCCVVRLEYATRTLTWACAGHPPPVLVEAGAASLLDVTAGPPLGVGPGAYACTARRVASGESILLYTDGLVERRGEDLTTGFGRLLRAAASAGPASPDSLVDAVLLQLAPGSQDDIAVLAVRVC
jgi:serine phosphatase RsbU (regulator of sigma subunit)